MDSPAPPVIFAPGRRAALRRRMRLVQARPDAPRYLMADMVEDVLERLAFLRHQPARALVVGDWSGTLAHALEMQGCAVTRADPAPGPGELALDEEAPYPFSGFDLIASLGTLDTVNDLPGALIHLRAALAPGGLLIASFPGAGCLPALRAAMLGADGERPAARMHPMVDVRAGGQLLQRGGFARPVVDSRTLNLRFGSLDALVRDLRAQGLSAVLARPGPPLGRQGHGRARAAFGQGTAERLEILTLSGWRG